jgi:hypothetical protein
MTTFLAFASEAQTIPHIRIVRRPTDLARVIIKLYRSGAAWVEVVQVDTTETEESCHAGS